MCVWLILFFLRKEVIHLSQDQAWPTWQFHARESRTLAIKKKCRNYTVSTVPLFINWNAGMAVVGLTSTGQTNLTSSCSCAAACLARSAFWRTYSWLYRLFSKNQPSFALAAEFSLLLFARVCAGSLVDSEFDGICFWPCAQVTYQSSNPFSMHRSA